MSRIAWGGIVVLSACAVVFAIFYLLPAGDPAALRAGRFASPEQIEAVRAALGLDQPVYVQFAIFLRDLLLHQDLGQSFQFGVPVTELIAERLPVTLLLIGGAVVIWLGVGVGLGVASAARPGSLIDRSSGAASLALLSAPVFWLGYLALLLFSIGAGAILPVLPGIGAYVEADSTPARLAAMILPWMVLGLSSAAIYVRLTRSTMTEQLSSGYVTAARARGLSENSILWGHAARTGLAPMLTLFGIDISLILAGNVILVESVFNIPGVGGLLTTAVERSDLPVIQGVVLIAAIVVVAVNLIIDMLYASIDPRVRLRER